MHFAINDPTPDSSGAMGKSKKSKLPEEGTRSLRISDLRFSFSEGLKPLFTTITVEPKTK